MADTWRPVAAALADEARRITWARVVTAAAVGSPVEQDALTARERRAVESLVSAGLVELDRGTVRPADPFSPLLGHRPAASGIDRFLRDGRIAAWPKRPADRAALPAWAVEHAVAEGETIGERQLTERLAGVCADPATLRRDLVDAGLLRREADGSAYRRA